MSQPSRKITITDIVKAKEGGDGGGPRKLVVVTAYDHPTSVIADRAGVEMILVGDSGATVALGYPDTRAVTMDEMLMMASAVSRGAKRALLVGDMPFMSFQVSVEDAIRNAGRFVKEAGMDAVKIEGGREFAPTVRALVRAGIPVMAHIGFKPQTTPTLEGYKVQGRSAESAGVLLEDARALEEAGAFAIVLEMVTVEAARAITDSISIPTIGIGSGHHCDGQVLVLHDLIGLFERFTPKFAKRYVNVASEIEGGIRKYREEVVSGKFPAEENVFHMDPVESEKLGLKRGVSRRPPPPHGGIRRRR